MKQALLTVGVLLFIGILFYYYIQNKVNPENDNYGDKSEVKLDLNEEKIIENKKEDINIKKEDQLQVNDKKENKMSQAIFKTNKGEFVVEFLKEQAPKTVENFIKLADQGFYNETKFHRVIEGFMNQGGDPLSKDDSMQARWGTGGPGYQFNDEITANNHNIIGTLSMANAGPNTNGSQFFINVANNNFLDTKHTVFGKVISGLDVVLAINSVSTDANDRPLEPIIIENIILK